MNLKEHYDTMWREFLTRFNNFSFQLDARVHSGVDDNCLGLIIRTVPPSLVRERVMKMLDELRGIAPDQYYYPLTDIHVTIAPVVMCREEYTTNKDDVNQYAAVIREATVSLAPFTIDFKGITASSGSVLIQGFPHNDALVELRKKLHTAMISSGLFTTMEGKAISPMAHSTVIRFTKQPDQLSSFLLKLAEYRSFNFGSAEVHTLELVLTDLYQKERNTTILQTFQL